jgi:arylsulfatase A-like enzyme/Flp pilus assembly protein TadD
VISPSGIDEDRFRRNDTKQPELEDSPFVGNYFIMHRQALLVIVALFLVIAGCSRRPESGETEGTTTPRTEMNILLITIDTLRADHLSCYGSKTVATPTMDALAARGVRFAQAIAQVPLTAPSHASILTGTYPQIHKVRDMGGFVMDQQIPTLAGILSQAGYQTAAFVGSAVLNRHYGLSRGFTTYSDEMKYERNGGKLPGVVAEIPGEEVTRRTIDWLERHLHSSAGAGSAKRFFLWAHYYDPHFPYDPPDPYKTQYAKDPYGGEVAYTDHEVGRLLSWLSESELGGKTLVLIMADHGESLGEHGEYTHGVFLYDSTVHIPLLVAGPGVPRGRVVTQQVRSIDILPTITDFLGLAPGSMAQGVSLKPAIVEGKGVRTNYCYMETLYPKTAMGWSELRGMRTDDWKLIVAPKPELYRIASDGVEATNVVGKYPADADHLQKKVWEVAGPPTSVEQLEPQLVDDERRRELNALGYVSSGRRTLQIDMSGPDPKDRVEVLEVLQRASDAANHGRWKEAAPLLESISKKDPTNPLIYTTLKMCYERLGQLDKLEKTCNRAIDNKVENDEILAELGEIQVKRGNLDRAIEYMEKAAKLNPGNLQNMDNLATAYLQLGRLADCQRTLEATLVQNERHGMAHNVFGILEIQRARFQEARRHLELAIQYSPELPEPYMNLGLMAQNAGNMQAAVAMYREFLKRADPEKHREYIPKVRAALADLGAAP